VWRTEEKLEADILTMLWYGGTAVARKLNIHIFEIVRRAGEAGCLGWYWFVEFASHTEVLLLIFES
jgi:hypothetical protein